MKIRTTRFIRGLCLLEMLLLSALDVSGGKPGLPQRHPPGRRQANMLMLRFQDALASERWQEALALCSERLRTSAQKRPTAKDFFTETMPIELVLAQDFGCWSCATNFYGMFVTLSEPGLEPRMDWYWALVPTENGWAIDYPPVNMDAYVLQKKAAIQERDERIKQIRQSLEPKVQGVKTRLTPVSDRFIIGKPMLFRVELVNAGPSPVHYMDSGVRHKSLTVLNENRETIPHTPQPMQIAVAKKELAPNTSIVLAEGIDITQGRAPIKPGRYFVQFNSADVQIGEPVPLQEMGRFGENMPMTVFDFLPATNSFPSNIVPIEVPP